MTEQNIPCAGQQVWFRDGDTTKNGIVNGEPRAYGEDPSEVTHVPVYVREGDLCMMVHVTNLLPEVVS